MQELAVGEFWKYLSLGILGWIEVRGGEATPVTYFQSSDKIQFLFDLCLRSTLSNASFFFTHGTISTTWEFAKRAGRVNRFSGDYVSNS